MKIKRFITEYANYQKESIISNELMNPEIKEKALNRIDNILLLIKKGHITIDETMSIIVNVLED